jgi:hypothetical protein
LYEILRGDAVFPTELQPLEVIRKSRKGYRPPIPEIWGQYMKSLISRCWSSTPSCRPSFDVILHEFREDRQYNILPGADVRQIHDVVEGVLLWESKACV